MGKQIKIFFVTDIHGSNLCYRKYLNALKAYNVDVGILLGDLTGKVLVPLVEKAGGGWAAAAADSLYANEGTRRTSSVHSSPIAFFATCITPANTEAGNAVCQTLVTFSRSLMSSSG